jgi:hypothetical protein
MNVPRLATAFMLIAPWPDPRSLRISHADEKRGSMMAALPVKQFRSPGEGSETRDRYLV